MEIRVTQLLFQIINFGILFYFLKKLVYKPILKVLDDRASRIKEGLEAAEKNINLRQEVEKSAEKSIADAKKQAAKIVSEAKEQAQDILKKARLQAKTESKQSLAKERQAFEAEKLSQAEDFKKHMTHTVTLATNAVLKGSLDKTLQQAIVDKQIKQLQKDVFN